MMPIGVLVLALELAQANLLQLNRRVASVEASMKAQSGSVDNMVMTLKAIMYSACLDKKRPTCNGDTISTKSL